MAKLDKKLFINFSILNISSFLNKVIGFFNVVFITHLVSQANFGLYSLLWAHLGLLASWQDLGTTNYGLLRENISQNKKKLNNLLVLRIALALIIGVITILLALIFNYSSQLIYLTIIFLAFYLSNAFSGYLLILSSINKELLFPALFSIIFNLITTGINVMVLLLTHDIFTMLWILGVGYLAYFLVIALFVSRRYLSINLKPQLSILKEVLKTSLLFSIISFFASVYFKADFVLLAKLAGNHSLAIYSVAYKFFDVALIIVTSYNLSSIPTFKLLYKSNRKAYTNKIKSDLLFLLGISGLLIVGTLVAASPLIHIFFPQTYLKAISLLNILIFSLPFILITSIGLNALYAQEKKSIIIFIIVAFLFQIVLNISLNIIFIPTFGNVASAYITVIGEIINATIIIGYLLYRLHHENLS